MTRSKPDGAAAEKAQAGREGLLTGIQSLAGAIGRPMNVWYCGIRFIAEVDFSHEDLTVLGFLYFELWEWLGLLGTIRP